MLLPEECSSLQFCAVDTEAGIAFYFMSKHFEVACEVAEGVDWTENRIQDQSIDWNVEVKRSEFFPRTTRSQ